MTSEQTEFDSVDDQCSSHPIRLSTTLFESLLDDLSQRENVEWTEDHYNLLYGHVIAAQRKSPDAFTRDAAQRSLFEGYRQILATSDRLRALLNQPSSTGLRRLLDAALGQNPRLQFDGPIRQDLVERVAASAKSHLSANSLVTRHQMVAELARALSQLAKYEPNIQLHPSVVQPMPLTRLIKLTQLSPDQLPD